MAWGVGRGTPRLATRSQYHHTWFSRGGFFFPFQQLSHGRDRGRGLIRLTGMFSRHARTSTLLFWVLVVLGAVDGPFAGPFLFDLDRFVLKAWANLGILVLDPPGPCVRTRYIIGTWPASQHWIMSTAISYQFLC